MTHRVKLTVLKPMTEDIYRDIARIPEIHRGGLKEGTLCLLKCNAKSVYVALRGLGDEQNAVIKIDDKTRGDLDVKPGDAVEFELKEICFLRSYWALGYASDPFARTSYRMSLIALVLGIISLAPPVIDWARSFCK